MRRPKGDDSGEQGVVDVMARDSVDNAGARSSDSGQSVLVVDDDPRLLESLCMVLASLPCEIIPARSGDEALTVLLQRRVAVIVLDINMPGIDGFETAQLVRETEELASTPIIFLTGQVSADSDVQRGYDLGAVDFLIKPVSRHVLYAKVKALLELDRSFSKLREEAAKFHERQLQAAREAEIRQREELIFTQRRERLTNIFAEASIDLGSLEKAIVTEFSHLFDADCVLRLTSPGHGWHDSLSHSGSGSSRLEEWLVNRLANHGQQPVPYPAIMIDELTARGKRVGVVCVGRSNGRSFTDIEAALFRSVTTAAALAVSNATLYRIQAEYAAVMQATGDAILAVGPNGEIRSCNKAATALFGEDYDELLGSSIFDFAVEAHRARLQDQLSFTLGSHQEASMEMTCISSDGRTVEVVVTLSPIGDSVELHVAAVVHDLTAIKQAQKDIRHLATHDPLTDLANRRELQDRLDEVVARRKPDEGTVALLYLDINEFKQVNDTYGHDTGDELLVEIASRLRTATRSGTLVCRIGGDEFVVVLEHVRAVEDAIAAGNRILDHLRSAPVVCKNATIVPSVSIGVACLGPDAHAPQDLLVQADLAMFEAKRTRSQECIAYSKGLGSRHNDEAHLLAGVSDAIEQSTFRMVYQPIFNTVTGATFGIEAFIRWRVRGEEIPASEIIALAEASKQIGALGSWIAKRSVSEYAALGRDDVQLHINLSPGQVRHPGFVDDLLDACRVNGVAPDRICLELTEHAFGHEDPEPVYATLRQARDGGFRLAIDDFGMQYASMANLLRLPVDWLKIDRTLVADVDSSDRTRQVVRAQIAVAATMHANLIAEGVENQTQADWLRGMGCELQQGYLYAHPQEVDALALFLAEQAPSAGVDRL
jgi:diguanylate cyclase (GGDEF)-like protein/PAS domain S-box-containing protein